MGWPIDQPAIFFLPALQEWINKALNSSWEIKSKLIPDNEEIIKMEFVDAVFYFKDGSELVIYSEKGIYNNKTLDMNFDINVKAKYEGSELFAQKAEYSNSKSFLMISN